jgi:aryl-alcohol dehydrogenase-like predicted oxidoreductase
MKKIILGTVQMGLKYGINNRFGKIPIEESHQILLKAYLSGINTLDTADAYGNAHQVIGQFHRTHPSYIFKIVTKVPHDIDAVSIEIKVKEYLEHLHVNCLEVLMFHSFESFIKNRKSIDILVDLKSKGFINKIGVSVYTNKQIEYLLTEDAVTVVQLPFNLLDNINARGIFINQLKAAGKIIQTRSAFLQGLFFKNPNDDLKIVQKLHSELEALNLITIESNCTMEELALSYCMQQNNIDNVIIGVDSVNQLESNLKAASYNIGEDSIEKINTIKIENVDLLNPSLWL